MPLATKAASVKPFTPAPAKDRERLPLISCETRRLTVLGTHHRGDLHRVAGSSGWSPHSAGIGAAPTSDGRQRVRRCWSPGFT